MCKKILVLLTTIFLLACGEHNNSPSNLTTHEQKAQTLSEVIQNNIPEMKNRIDGTFASKASHTIAVWGSDNMKWDDLNSLPEASYSLAIKDINAVRGQKICTSGEVLNIEGTTIENKKMYYVNIMDDELKFYNFLAIKSAGNIVAKSKVKFCGVLINWQRANFGNGTIDAVHLVGMFDLPENK